MSARSLLPQVTCILLFTATVAGAQVKPGDLIIGNYGTPTPAVLAITPGTNTHSTVARIPASLLRGVMVGPQNTDYYVGADLTVFKVAPGGAITTLVSKLPAGVACVWCDQDEDGKLLFGTGYAGVGELYRIDPGTGGYTTILKGFFPNAFCLDRDSGDIVTCDYGVSPQKIIRIKRDGTATTILNSPSSVFSMDFYPPTGDVLFASTPNIYRVDALNTLTTFNAGAGYAKAMAVLADGTVAIGANGQTTIRQLDAQGKVIGNLYSGATIDNVCMVVDDEHNLWGLNTPTPGATFFLSVRFAAFAGRPYVTAASLAPRPGIPIDSRTIPLLPDNLFAASTLLPQIFVKFVGVLDANGQATPSIAIPKIPSLRGFRIFLAAVVIDPRAPSSIGQISQEYGATIQ